MTIPEVQEARYPMPRTIRHRWAAMCAAACATILTGYPMAHAQEANAPRVCVLPVRGSDLASVRGESPGNTYFGSASLILAKQVNMLPSVPLPFLYPRFDKGLYTITADNSLAGFSGAGDFDYSYGFSRALALDGSTGRVVGINQGGLFTYDPEDASRAIPTVLPFHRVAPGVAPFPISVAYIERLSTVMVGTEKGAFRLRGDTIEALPGSDEQEAGGIGLIVDLPVHRAVLFAGNDRIVLRHDDGSSEILADLRGPPPRKYLMGVHESTRPGRLVLDLSGELIEITMAPTSSGYAPVKQQPLLPAERGRSTDLMTPSGEFLFLARIGRLGYGLRRLDDDGVHDVPGDMPENPASFDEEELWRTTLPGGALVGTSHGLYRYDGYRTVLVPDSSTDRIGRIVSVIPLPLIDLTVVATERGLLVLDPSGRLKALETPPGYSITEIGMSELPTVHVGLISTGHALYTLDRHGTIRSIPGDTHDRYLTTHTFLGVIPRRDIMLVGGQEALHLIATGADCDGQASRRG